MTERVHMGSSQDSLSLHMNTLFAALHPHPIHGLVNTLFTIHVGHHAR